MLAFYVFCGVVLTALLALVVMLLRAGLARPLTVWSLAALMPLLAALAAASGHRAQAAAVLEGYQPQEAALVLKTGRKEYDLLLSPQQAACLERTLRLGVEADLTLPDEKPVPVRRGTEVTGELPRQKYVEALAVQGRLRCAEFRHVAAER